MLRKLIREKVDSSISDAEMTLILSIVGSDIKANKTHFGKLPKMYYLLETADNTLQFIRKGEMI